MKNVNKEIIEFSEFLNSSWRFVNPFYDSNELINETLSDWLQANWEIIVERKVCGLNEFLEVYGDGAESNGEYSRITFFEKIPTHTIKVLPKKLPVLEQYQKKEINIQPNAYLFKEFIGKVEGKYLLHPPFYLIEAWDDEADQLLCFKLNDMNFYIDIVSD